jgi:hypothetical protein
MAPASVCEDPSRHPPGVPRPFLIVGLSLLANILLSLTILPHALPPFQGYALSDVGEVLLWQGIAVIGWPIALLGLVLSIPFGARLTSAAPLLFIVVYPAVLFLLLRMAISRRVRPWEVVLLNLLVTVSFAVLWYYVLNGYDFMVG